MAAAYHTQWQWRSYCPCGSCLRTCTACSRWLGRLWWPAETRRRWRRGSHRGSAARSPRACRRYRSGPSWFWTSPADTTVSQAPETLIWIENKIQCVSATMFILQSTSHAFICSGLWPTLAFDRTTLQPKAPSYPRPRTYVDGVYKMQIFIQCSCLFPPLRVIIGRASLVFILRDVTRFTPLFARLVQ